MTEYKLLIGGIEHGMGDIEAVNIESPLFDKLSAGNACAAELTASFWPLGSVPRMAEIVPFARKSPAEEWKQLGVFYIDERSSSPSGKMSVVAYNSMLKAEAEWVPRDELVFPMPMPEAVAEIARLMGIEVDPRTKQLNSAYTIDYPANGYTLRDVLRFIAGAHVGNWIITAQNKLLLLPLFGSCPPETFNLVTNEGDAILLGGVRLRV